ncbi:MAG: hypothetical protein JRJ85_02285 [Deltaproteobacteria bacterium]|nr:hypothetical protein [Deltaproteobacteria bacterium]
MENITGPPARGEQLKFRDKDISEILLRLSAGNSVLMIGLRRIGKSSVMWGVHDRAPGEWITSYHDVQSMRSPTDFFTIMLQSLPKGKREQVIEYWSRAKTIPTRLLNFIKSHFKKLGGEGISMEFQSSIIDYWYPLTEGIEQALKNNEQPILMVLDEFPLFVEHMLKEGSKPNMLEQMLGQLRTWRESNYRFRLLIGGSISLDRILSKSKISAHVISDLSRYLLSPLNRDEANAFLRELAESHQISWYDDRLIDETLDLIQEYYPYFLQAFFQQIRNYGSPDQGMTILFENYFIPAIRQSFFNQFLIRLRTHYGKPAQTAARAIFDLISTQEESIANYSQIADIFSNMDERGEVDLDELLYDLISDDFLYYDSRTNEYAFAASIVARWWQITRGRK